MKLIHLNVESFKYFDALVDFLESEKPDIISLVEATDGGFFAFQDPKSRDYIGELATKFGWSAVYHPTVFRDFGNYRTGFGAAVLSRFPLYCEQQMYLGGERETSLPYDHIVFSDRPRYERYAYAWKFHLPFLSTIIETPEGRTRILTAHFHVSYDCLETLQIWQDAEKVAAYIDTLDDTPLILTGDLNIRNESMAIRTLAEKMTQQSHDFINTLTPSIHPYFHRVIDGQGLGVDHIFTRNVHPQSCKVDSNVVVSDHLPLILIFNI